MLRSLLQKTRDYWHAATPTQRVLFMAGSLLFVWMVVHGALLALTDHSLHGPVSYRKAATFAETGWLMCWSVGYVLPYLSLTRRQRTLIVGGTLLFALGETFLMSLQVWRGEPSHYNFTTPANSFLFGTTGIIALLWLGSMGLLLWRVWRSDDLSHSLRIAYGAGTALMIFGGVTGYLMMFNLSGIYQGEFMQSAQALITGGMLGDFTGQPEGTGGNIVLLHALGVHGLSMLPLAAWLLGYTSLDDAQQVRVTSAVTSAYLLLIALLTVPVLRAQPLMAMSTAVAVLLALVGGTLLLLYAWIVRRSVPRLLRAR